MAKYRFSKKALSDLIEIWDYSVEEWSQNQAEKYYQLIIASCLDLANNPKPGKRYEILSMDVLGYKCGQHIIFYRQVLKDEIVIDRILHSMMDLKSKI